MIVFDKVELGFRRFTAGFAIIGGLGLIFATAVTCLSIVLKLIRRTLDFVFGPWDTWAFIRPILGEEELVSYGVGFALFAALPWVMMQRGHIRIDLFHPLFSRRFNRVLDFCADFILLIIAYLIMTQQWFLLFKKGRQSQDTMLEYLLRGDLSVFVDRLRVSHESQILGIPLWPTYGVAEACVILFFITAGFCTVQSARAVIVNDLSE